MKEFWLEKSECTGCGACENICPRSAITMEIDETGFIYPTIGETCVDCNLCEKICKNRKLYQAKRFEVPKTYALWSKNKEVRFNSTSGGAFTELAKIILANNGLVAGACYNEENMVEHILIEKEDELPRIRQSKYIQSNPLHIYSDIKRHLNQGRLVAFCGAPCQVAGLYAFLGNKEYENLVTFDFICRGMNSPKAFRSWLDEIEAEEKSKVTRVWFKYKEGGWKSSPKRARLDFEDGHYVVKSGEANLFMHGYLSNNLYIRPSCGNCDFKGVPRHSDITLADFWGIEAELDDDQGTSLVLINSEKGKKLFEQARAAFEWYERDFGEIFKGNVCFEGSVNVPKESEQFLKALDTGKFSEVLKKYSKVSFGKKVKNKLKRFLRR